MLARSLLHDLDRQHWLRWFVTAGVKGPAVPQGTLFEGFNLLHSALLAGQGIGLAPTAILSGDLKAGRLVKLFETETLHEMGYFIVEPSQHRSSRARAIETFKQWLLEQAKA
jgi:LysR family glycine cleavage system transcriptional activator